MHEEKIELKKEFERRLPEVIQKSKMELKLVLENDGYKKIPTPKSIDNTKFCNNTKIYWKRTILKLLYYN